MQLQLTELHARALSAIAEIEDTTPTALLMPSINDIANGRHVRNGGREEVTEGYVAWLESKAIAAKEERDSQLALDIGA